MGFPGKKITKFQTFIFDWWESNKRDLPWRKTHDPYKIAVSEVMLQQTQVSRVIPIYEKFLYFFPDVFTLATASTAHVLREWKGMGYNRRALYLKRMAREVVKHHKGEFPKDEKLLVKLPGLGMYTARAILVFAYRENTAMVDTNIRKIITHFFYKGRKQKDMTIQHTADMLVPKGKSWEWHQALMDYGALALPKIKPNERNTKSIPFQQTNRYLRGRIMDLVRDRDWNETKLLHFLESQYKKPKAYCASRVEDLVSEGLLVRKPQKIISLPD